MSDVVIYIGGRQLGVIDAEFTINRGPTPSTLRVRVATTDLRTVQSVLKKETTIEVVSSQWGTVVFPVRPVSCERGPAYTELYFLDARYKLQQRLVWGRYNLRRSNSGLAEYLPSTLNGDKLWDVESIIKDSGMLDDFDWKLVSGNTVPENLSFEGVTAERALQALLTSTQLNCVYLPTWTILIGEPVDYYHPVLEELYAKT